jgi:hypothetical protein
MIGGWSRCEPGSWTERPEAPLVWAGAGVAARGLSLCSSGERPKALGGDLAARRSLDDGGGVFPCAKVVIALATTSAT